MASIASTGPRARYRPSGRVNLLRLLAGLPLALLVAFAVAWLLALLFGWGIYLLLLFPMVAAAIVALAGGWLIRWSCCRSPALASLSGFLLGSFMFLSFYHCDMLNRAGWANVLRVDVLPDYIRLRIATDQVQRFGRGAPKPGDHSLLNWVFFAGELLASAGIAGIVARKVAVSPFCEIRKRWMVPLSARLDLSLAPVFGQAIEAGQLAEVLRAARPLSEIVPQFVEVVVHHSPAVDSHAPPPGESPEVLLSVKQVTVQVNAKDQQVRIEKELVTHLVLLPDEVQAATELFPDLSADVTTSTVSPISPASQAPALREGQAWVRDLPRPVGDQLVGTWRMKFAFALMVVPFFGLLGAGMALGIRCLATNAPGARDAAWWLQLALAMGLFFGGLAFGAVVGAWPSNYYIYRAVRKFVRRRADRIVDPDDPEVVFVETVPRSKWTQTSLTSTDDVGFLRIDRAAGAILFEGDRRRWSIPVSEMVSCEPEIATASGVTEGKVGLPVVVLRALVGDQVWEAPLKIWYYGMGNPTAEIRRANAEKLLGLIRSLDPDYSEA